MEGGGSAAVPHELTGAGRSAATPEASIERGGSVAAPSEIKETSPPAQEQGVGSKQSRPDESRFLRRGHSLGLAPKKSLALQAGWTTLPDVAPISGRSGADAVASLADPAAPVVVPAPLVVAEQATSSVAGAAPPAGGLASPVGVAATAPSQEQPDMVMVMSDGVAQSVPTVAQATAPDAGWAEEDVAGGSPTLMSLAQWNVAMVASEGAAQFVPSEAWTEVTVTTTSPTGSDVAMVASEGAAQSAPPAAQAAAPKAGRMEEDMAEGSPGVVAVVERTRRMSPPALLSGGSSSSRTGGAAALVNGHCGRNIGSFLA
ncbi:uncharacterized protein [Miscanthus floridulus]|uniref:uncharacterized protein n=1 Tax=Miscanthus floridulus TaxID=154761 RepID=UPI003459CE33